MIRKCPENGLIGKLARIVHGHAHPEIPRVVRETAHLRVHQNDSSTAADVQHFQRRVFAHLVESAPHWQGRWDVPNRRRS
jgi:hypothetical protein